MGKIQRQNQAIRALVIRRKIALKQLAITRAEAISQFDVTKAELTDALSTGILGYSLTAESALIPVWRLDRLWPRR